MDLYIILNINKKNKSAAEQILLLFNNLVLYYE